MPDTRISSTVDFEKIGRQTGFLQLPHSVHESAYGWIPIPVVCLKNGNGPTVLLSAGNHGDEYEGQVTLMKLIRELQPEQVRGRIIILPAENFPAAMAGRRTSPIDGGNLNRLFPGAANGTPTQMIAHYLDTVILPMCDYMFDLHSGGSSMMMYGGTYAIGGQWPGEAELNAKVRELMKVFGAPISQVVDFSRENALGIGPRQTQARAASYRGVVWMEVEAGGAGTVTPTALKMEEAGLRRLLTHLKVVEGLSVEPSPGTRYMEVGGADYFVYATESGVFEPLAELGDTVRKDQPAAVIHFPHTPWREPETLRFGRDGLVVCKRVPARTERGDCLFQLATDRQ